MNIEQQDLQQERLGLTGALQWKPNENTNIGLDMVYSKFDQKSDVNQIQSVGLNRNNTNAAFNSNAAPTNGNAEPAAAPTQPATARRRLPFREAINCGGSEAVAGGVFAGLGTTSFSTNPNNLDTLRLLQQPDVAGLRRVAGRHVLPRRNRRPAGRRCARRPRVRRGKCRLSRAAQCGLAFGDRFVVLHDAVPAGFVELATEHRRSAEGGRALRPFTFDQ